MVRDYRGIIFNGKVTLVFYKIIVEFENMFTIFKSIIIAVISLYAFQASALTFKSGEGIVSRENGNDAKAPSVVVDLVTQAITASELSDDELCLSLKHVDLVSTYDEMKARGLDCLHISKTPSSWTFKTQDQAFKYLRLYQEKYDVSVPDFDLANYTALEDKADIFETLIALNPEFKNDIRGLSKLEDYYRQSYRHFCLDWYPQIAYVANDQSKNLDGSVSWDSTSLVDGFVECQDDFSHLAYFAMHDDEIRQDIQTMIENWVNSDRPHREQDGGDSFMYPYLINRIFIAIDLLHHDFGWSEEDYDKAGIWMKNRAIEVFPGEGVQHLDKLSQICELNKNRIEGRNSEVCQNGGIMQAQTLLRAGLFSKDEEFVELAFIAFHRYMSGIRKDGSNAADSRRGCTAADYNNWAAEFMSDFIYLWSQISEPLWEHRSFERGSPRDAIKYALSLFGNWEKINEHTIDVRWQGCGTDKRNRTQEAGTKYNGEYSKLAFSPYLEIYEPDLFIELLAHYTRYNYVRGSGQALDVNIVASRPDLMRDVIKFRKKNNIRPDIWEDMYGQSGFPTFRKVQ